MTITTTREKTSDTRTIPINQTALAVLKERARVKSISGYVFFNAANKMIDRWNLKSRFNEAVKESGIEKFRFHDLRHSFATRLAQGGVDIYKISKLLGHKDVTTTQRYAHHYPESLRSSVELLDSATILLQSKKNLNADSEKMNRNTLKRKAPPA